VTGVVDAVGEEQDEITDGSFGGWAKLIATGYIDGVEERGTAETAGVIGGGVAESGSDGVDVGGPVLTDLRIKVEAHEEGLVCVFVKEVFKIFACCRLVLAHVSEHGSAGVHQDADPNRKISIGFVEDDPTLWLAVVEDAEVALLEIIHRDAVEVGYVEGKAHFINGHADGVGRLRSRGSGEKEDECRETSGHVG